MHAPSRSALVVAVLLLGSVACSPEPADARGEAVQDPAPAAAGPSEVGTLPTALTDPEIAHVAVTANAIDVELAHLARDRTTTPGVLAFARTMISDHTAVNERATALAERLGVVPADNSVSRSLRAGADDARRRLSVLEGEGFDGAYLEREVAFHRAVLDALDATLIPQSSNAELRALLEQVRPAIAAHLDHARSLQKAREEP